MITLNPDPNQTPTRHEHSYQPNTAAAGVSSQARPTAPQVVQVGPTEPGGSCRESDQRVFATTKCGFFGHSQQRRHPKKQTLFLCWTSRYIHGVAGKRGDQVTPN